MKSIWNISKVIKRVFHDFITAKLRNKLKVNFGDESAYLSVVDATKEGVDWSTKYFWPDLINKNLTDTLPLIFSSLNDNLKHFQDLV